MAVEKKPTRRTIAFLFRHCFSPTATEQKPRQVRRLPWLRPLAASGIVSVPLNPRTIDNIGVVEHASSIGRGLGRLCGSEYFFFSRFPSRGVSLLLVGIYFFFTPSSGEAVGRSIHPAGKLVRFGVEVYLASFGLSLTTVTLSLVGTANELRLHMVPPAANLPSSPTLR